MGRLEQLQLLSQTAREKPELRSKITGQILKDSRLMRTSPLDLIQEKPRTQAPVVVDKPKVDTILAKRAQRPEKTNALMTLLEDNFQKADHGNQAKNEIRTQGFGEEGKGYPVIGTGIFGSESGVWTPDGLKVHFSKGKKLPARTITHEEIAKGVATIQVEQPFAGLIQLVRRFIPRVDPIGTIRITDGHASKQTYSFIAVKQPNAKMIRILEAARVISAGNEASQFIKQATMNPALAHVALQFLQK